MLKKLEGRYQKRNGLGSFEILDSTYEPDKEDGSAWFGKYAIMGLLQYKGSKSMNDIPCVVNVKLLANFSA